MIKRLINWYLDVCDWFRDMAAGDTPVSSRHESPREEVEEYSLGGSPGAHEIGWEGNLTEMMEKGTAGQISSAIDDYLDDRKA